MYSIDRHGTASTSLTSCSVSSGCGNEEVGTLLEKGESLDDEIASHSPKKLALLNICSSIENISIKDANSSVLYCGDDEKEDAESSSGNSQMLSASRHSLAWKPIQRGEKEYSSSSSMPSIRNLRLDRKQRCNKMQHDENPLAILRSKFFSESNRLKERINQPVINPPSSISEPLSTLAQHLESVPVNDNLIPQINDLKQQLLDGPGLVPRLESDFLFQWLNQFEGSHDARVMVKIASINDFSAYCKFMWRCSIPVRNFMTTTSSISCYSSFAKFLHRFSRGLRVGNERHSQMWFTPIRSAETIIAAGNLHPELTRLIAVCCQKKNQAVKKQRTRIDHLKRIRRRHNFHRPRIALCIPPLIAGAMNISFEERRTSNSLESIVIGHIFSTCVDRIHRKSVSTIA
jgi:hypothetical protein